MFRKFYVVAVVAIMLLSMVAFTACSGRHNLNGTWHVPHLADHAPTEITFFGRNFTMNFDAVGFIFGPGIRDFRYRDLGYEDVLYGTFSLTDNQVEFVFSCGLVNVLSFSRTENTVSIGRWGQFIRK